jgi:hypothetical protein
LIAARVCHVMPVRMSESRHILLLAAVFYSAVSSTDRGLHEFRSDAGMRSATTTPLGRMNTGTGLGGAALKPYPPVNSAREGEQ